MSNRNPANSSPPPEKKDEENLLLLLALAERKQSLTAQKLEARNREISAIYRLSETIGSERQVNRLCEETAEEIRRTLGAATVRFLLQDEHTGDLVTAASTGTTRSGVSRKRVKKGVGLLWQVMKTGKPLQLSLGARSARQAGGTPSDQNGIAVPVKTRGKTFGVIYACGKRNEQVFSASERDMLCGIANQAAVALENATLYHDLENVFVGVAWSFASALDAKSPWTAGHSKRVTQYAVAIAEELNQGAEFLNSVQACGLLHDIGKLAVPERLLEKPGVITRDEHLIICEHAVKGANILGHIDTFQPFLPGIRHHHERWDGSGFPDGLRSDDIPLIARVLAVADSYDAITSDRPYRRRRCREEAFEEIKRCSGTQFDPQVVEAFVAVSSREAI
jgi:putative nucleotidyltransferase with HDIG domain